LDSGSHPTHDGATEGGRLKSFRSPDQLVSIYRASQENRPHKEIAAEHHISVGSVATALTQLDKYLKGKDRNQNKRSFNYREAAKLIRQGKRKEPLQPTTEPPRQPQTTSQGDNFAFLKNSFEKFQDAVSTFIEVELNSRCTSLHDENTALKEDNKELRKKVTKLQEEIERLKNDAEEPQTLDWIDSLQSKLTKEET
jgi:hypothetical protein